MVGVAFIRTTIVGCTIYLTLFDLQVHKESMHLVTITSNVLNKSLDPDLVEQSV